MKKIIFSSLVVLILISSIKVQALSIWDTEKLELKNQSSIIKEEITPIRNDKGKLKGIDVVITIPEDCTEKELIISPSIFETINGYKHIMPGDKIKINFKVINNSPHNYLYKDNSLLISTADISKLGIEENFTDTNAIGFDGNKIYTIFSPYRTFNSAMMSLYNYTSVGEQKDEDLQDENLTIKLQEKGYKGVEELDKYYLDFYNNKYNLKEDRLDKFTYSTIKEMFSGNRKEVKETNPEIIALSYNYFYNKLLSYTFKDQTITDATSENYSIGNYMRTRGGNDYFKEAFNLIKSNTSTELNDMSLNINGLYTVNIFVYYNFSGHLEFVLEKEVQEETGKVEEGEIIPPYTGIE